jgi:hypothetical protein
VGGDGGIFVRLRGLSGEGSADESGGGQKNRERNGERTAFHDYACEA